MYSILPKRRPPLPEASKSWLRNNKTFKIFERFVQEKVVYNRREEGKIGMKEASVEEILLREIKKKVGKPKIQFKKMYMEGINSKSHFSFEKFLKKQEEYNKNNRNLEQIVFCLQQYPKFQQFVRFNNITFDRLISISAFLTHEFYPKGAVVYVENKKLKKIYGIIRGSVNIRRLYGGTREEEVNCPSSSSSVTVLKKGSVFGWNQMMINSPPVDSCFASEDTDLFVLQKEHFDKFLLSVLSRAEMDRKLFISSKIPAFKLELSHFLVPEFYEGGEVIYTPFDISSKAFLILSGCASLRKVKNVRNKAECLEKKKEGKVISIIDEGGIAGVESCRYGKNKSSLYDNTLVSISSPLVVYKIDLEFILKKKQFQLFKSLLEFLSSLYEEQKKVNNERLNLSNPNLSIIFADKKKENFRNNNTLNYNSVNRIRVYTDFGGVRDVNVLYKRKKKKNLKSFFFNSRNNNNNIALSPPPSLFTQYTKFSKLENFLKILKTSKCNKGDKYDSGFLSMPLIGGK